MITNGRRHRRSRRKSAMYVGPRHNKIPYLLGSARKSRAFEDPKSLEHRCWQFYPGDDGDPVLVLERHLKFL